MPYALEHKTRRKISAGSPHPLGSTPSPDGVNFAIFSGCAQEVFLLLFDRPEGLPTDVIKLEHRSENVWHVFVHGIQPGQLYGYKIRGDYRPDEGLRFNEYKLLMGPYAKAVAGKARKVDKLLFGYDPFSPVKDLAMDRRDNTTVVPKGIVMEDRFDWQNDKPPDIPPEKLIIYEVHVKGFTRHFSSQVRYPGTYLGFVEKIPYLKELGVNAVELLPIHEFYVRDFLVDHGLSEYWGYNSISFFAPEISFSTQSSPGCQVREFKTLVRQLHNAGIEIILDVAFNHTGEGNELGPTLCFRGIDNLSYYVLKGTDREPYRHYEDKATGCLNQINSENPAVLRMIMDSLRYWVNIMHVDGFRFDLAPLLAHQNGRYSKDSAFFEAIRQDPILQKVKLIAEPWDLTTYQVGNFPKGWSEWNGKFRDSVRKFLRGDSGEIREFAVRMTGSRDLYAANGRFPWNSINYITCHDGFTLRDLYSYAHKHNEANFENNRNGSNENFPWNCGIEGETPDTKIQQLRERMTKNALLALFCSLGTPMMYGGDEMFRTQRGNNNTYCQDNEISWFDWDFLKKYEWVFNFCKKAIAFRKRYAVFGCKKFYARPESNSAQESGISWFNENLGAPSWNDPWAKVLCYQLDANGTDLGESKDRLFFIYNADMNSHKIQLPQYPQTKWYRIVDTNLKGPADFLDPGFEICLDPQDFYWISSKSVVILLGR
ncbi:MAG: glycogen debranching protein GlgX [Candidatus Omnitrophica bacterium]|nr:glycogen debranching protein GlgX [Candidatus Omnitrophota bacterium]